MSYTELESGYHSLKQASSSDGEGGAIQATSGRPGFYVGDEGDLEPTDGLDSDESSNSGKQVVVAVCAMSKKSQSKPMKEILTRLQEFEYIRMVVLGEEIILNEPVDRWPQCDCLISFHSKGFPLDKAIQYAQLRQPYVINNLHMQFDIQDRRRVYAILEHEGIEIPRYAVLDRDSLDPKQHELVESEDHVEVNGIVFNKPFVEKPVSAEDHNIYIYYPTSAGGGSQRLFRKIGSRSSVYSPESRVRKTGSFIYEDFMPTDGTDVKVYTVGPDYAHAEARKSPALDGKVERDSDGKEIRYPVILGNAEKLISRKVCLAFKQTVCGFDLLRANGKSFVCDVNGFSFVKNSNKYYDDCAKILGNMILRELAPQLHIPWSVPFQLDDPPIVPTTFGKMMELRCVTAVIRHGDRTPKQKMKVEVRHQKFFEIFEKYDGYRFGHIKLKRPKQLQEILDIARSLLAEIQTKAADSEIEEKQSKLEQLKSVLEMYGHFSGINRKVQMKYQPKGRPRGSSSDDGKHDCNVPKEPSLVLILKWGGELTPAGRIQAEEMGRIFRCMYPGGQSRQPGVSEGPGTQGLGLLRLHSTFRHDLKIYASDEGRVQMTAAAFAKGLLALEGELTPILVQMVKSANTNGLLDNDCDSSKYQNMAKSRLHELMQTDREFTSEDRTAINPGNAISINLAMNFVKNPVQCCSHVHSLIRSLMAVVAVKRDDPKTRDATLYHGETWELMGRRWGKIEKDFCTKSKSYDISKIPDIYDCIKYDLQHNQHTLQFDLAEELYISAKYLADIVIPQEYGLTMHEKLTIGQGICTPLLKKIRADLQRNIEEVGGNESVNRLNPRYSYGVSSPGRHVRTRLYFTSESHVHSLLTVLRHGGLLNMNTDEQWRRAMEYVSMVSELNYMSQIVIMLYEDPMKDPSSEERFHVELHFSPGVNCCVQKNLPPGPGFRPHSRNDSVTSKNASGDEDSTSRIDEENDTEEECSVSNSVLLHQTLSKTIFWDGTKAQSEVGGQTVGMVMKERRTRKVKSSSPIPIGSCHTVSGHEAMDLAKRLSEELAVQQQQQHNQNGSCGMFGGIGGQQQRALSPDTEPRARSFEHEQSASHDHHHHHVCAKSSTRRAKDGGDCRMATSTVTTTTAALAAAAPAAAPLRTNGSDPSVLAPSSNSGGFGIRASCCCSQSAHCRDGATPVTSAAGVASRTPGGGTKTVVPHGGSPNSTSSSQSSCGGCCCCCGCDCCYCAPSLALTGAGTGTTGTTATTAIRRQRHSIAGQMSYFKMLGTFSKKMATSTNSLFSTAVISGSSSAPNLRDMIPSTASPSGFGGVPPIRPLETLHNALSLRQLDTFLDRMTVTSLFKTPASSPPPKHPVCQPMAELQRNTAAPTSLAGLARSIVPEQTTGRSSELLADKRIATASLSTPNDMVEPVVRQANAELPSAKPVTDDPCTSVPVVSSSTAPCPRPAGSLTAADGTAVGNGAASGASQSWSDHSSMTSSISALSSGGPSSPNFSELPSTDMSASITSTSSSLAAAVDGNRRADQLGCMLNLFTHPTNNRHRYPATGESMVASASGAGLIFPIALSSSIAETYSKTEDGVPIGHGVIERRGSTLDDNGDLTPISIYSDWDNTAQPTKCSTSTANELQAAMEEDDDDATISIDTCLSTRTTSEQQATLAREWPPTVATRGVHQFPQTAEKTANLAFSTNSVRPPGVPARRTMSVGISAEFAKIEDNAGGPIRGSRIQRQISLYERDSRTEANNSTQEREPPVRCPGSKPILQLHMSLDEQRKDLSSLSGGGSDQQKCLRTRQLHSRDESGEALTLTSNATHAPVNPGALLIREGFIDPPRLTRVTKSFHGKTDHQTEQHQQKHREHGRRTASIEDGSRWSHMDDSGASGNVGCGDNTLLGRYITNCNRQQSVGSAGSSGGGLYQGRFTMLIVQEPPPEKALTNTGVPLARESFSRDDGDTSKK
ncbi:inositol hexakisphosphate and diphosphoinositol-pentakisphosphate kinase isoform X5 [Anopheles cruzii]|uniref:inositol hexakisphosphate and diphosphoinositol-pentakisphosphate kinase isoform X5 n=1 Tax=Anopheles cruzii TaxID=68878 RepID=UPI0022EC64F6|nr:inositol hexakisphosphate and diphosphoinositol-pentakisphosphate kinase isoform X5 [Anopheles cruzii]